jgi:hypothetical protein
MATQDLEWGEAQRKKQPNSKHIDHHVLSKQRLKAIQAFWLPSLNLKRAHDLNPLLGLILLVEM